MPGFSDAYRSDTEILSDIASWLRKAYANNILLTGIIYLHRIIDPSLEGSAMRNLRVFKQLCGGEAFASVVLVTTFWNHVDNIVGRVRESELINTEDLWGYMISMGSRVYRQDNSKTSARTIVALLIMMGHPVVLEIQQEMVVCGKTLDVTAAGSELEFQLTQQRREAEEQFKEIQGEL